MRKEYRWKVAAKCFTYNQRQYITDTLNGFVLQQTDFPYVCCIVDDASTDGEQEVIKKYVRDNFDLSELGVAYKKETEDAHITYARHKGNRNCFFAVIELKRNLYHERVKKSLLISEWIDNSEYIAFCEGDDYWTNASKLRMQVDFLDSNPDYGMSHTDFDLVEGKRNHSIIIHKDGNYWPYSLTEGLQVGTLTVMLRTSVYNKLPKLFMDKDWLMSDKPLWIEVSRFSKIHYLPIVTAKYRILESSASHGSFDKLVKFLNCSADISDYYADKFGVHIEKREKSKSYHECIMRFACRFSSREAADVELREAIKHKCVSVKLLLFYLGANFKVVKKLLGVYSTL